MPLTTWLQLIGGTPLVEVPRLSPRPGVRLFAKLEGQNPSGSIKDRVALALIEQAEQAGRLRPGGTVVEASSGNTGIALATICRQRGYGAHIVVPADIPASILDLLRLLGAELTMCGACSGLTGCIRKATEIAQREGHVLLGQFHDPLNVETHYQTTGQEIVEALDRVDVFVSGIGTGGTLMGVGRRLREAHPRVRLIGIEPRMGDRLQGLRCLDDASQAPLLDLEVLDGRYLVDAATALRAAERMTRAEGIFAGVSGGACLHAALRAAERLEEGNVVFMCSDGGWKYLPASPWDAAQRGDAALDEVHWW